MRFRVVIAALCLLQLCTVVALAARTTNYPIGKQPLTGPASAIEAYAEAFRHRDPAGIDAVLTADYTFHAMTLKLEEFTDGNSRAKELEVVDHLLNGIRKDGQVVIPPPQSVSMSIDGVNQGIDPEHADSTEHYRVLTVTRLGFTIVRDSSHKLESAPSVHVFHVVRGDAARLAPGQTADPQRWYIRRWFEDIRGVNAALREKQGECGDEPADPSTSPAAALPHVPGVLAVRALTNPACAAMRMQLELPGRETARVQVYDVSGRLVNERTLASPEPGTVSIDAGAGSRAPVLPGVYWVRVMQAKRPPGVRMVVVAR